MEQGNQIQKAQCKTSYLVNLLKEYPKIRSLKNNTPIRQALLRCFVLVGISPRVVGGKDVYFTKEEELVLMDFITKTYPGHVAPEIIKAFEMAINREFHDIDHDKLLAHYGKFSPEYLARIMNVYNEQERSRVLAASANVTPLYKEPEYDRIAGYEIGLFSKFDNFCQTGDFKWTQFEAAAYYTSLKELGLITDTKEERMQFGVQAREITPKKVRKSIFELPESDADYNRRVIRAGKYLSFENWIREHALNETDLRALITPLIVNK